MLSPDPDESRDFIRIPGPATQMKTLSQAAFLASSSSPADMPPPGPPEIAFAGRSNVGKSSLLNALTGRKSLARVSNTPGRTQQINFFDLGRRLMLVDLPGYGYASAPKANVRVWTRLIEDYLRGRRQLKRVVLLIDARHGLKPHDRDVMDVLDQAAVNYQLVLTKADKLKPTEADAVSRATQAAIAKRPAAHPEVILTSAQTGLGIEWLRAEIAALA